MNVIDKLAVIVGVLLILAGICIGVSGFLTVQTLGNNFVPAGIAMLFFVSAFVALLVIEFVLLVCRWVYKNREEILNP